MNQKTNRIRKILVGIVLVGAILGFSRCEKYQYTPPVINEEDTLSFQVDIQPIFTSNCITCHGGTVTPDLRAGKSYQSLTTGGYVTKPGETSKLYTKMTSSSHASRSSDADKQKVLIWINQGALNN